jgi:RNA polymerase sigma-70 factor (family 1)
MIEALPNERELVIQLIAGDAVAFNHIYDHYQPTLCIFAFRFTKSKPAAEEIVQEVFIKLWEHRHQVEPGHHFESYLKTIARNHILNMLKKAARDKVLQQLLYERMQALSFLPADRLHEKEIELLHQQAILTLSPRQKMAYILRKQEGMSYAEIADQLHVSKHTAKNQAGEAMRNIRRQLAGVLRIFF